jgi:hypothetical protein
MDGSIRTDGDLGRLLWTHPVTESLLFSAPWPFSDEGQVPTIKGPSALRCAGT